MQIIRYKSSSGITLGMSHHGQLIQSLDKTFFLV